ncbi:MAG TPA: MFS transporter [Trebonia sp.]|jgi:MFS family permease
MTMTKHSRQQGAGPALTVALTAVAFFMVVLDGLVVVTALPSIHRALGGSLATLQWTVNAYNIAAAAGIITGAALGDRLGRRRVYATGLAVFTMGSALSAVGPGIGLLIAARAVQGLGAALIIPLSLTILSAAFPPAKRGTVTGLWGGVCGLGVAGGPLIGGAVALGAFLAWEARTEEPMIPLGLFRTMGFSAAVAVSFLVGAGLCSAVFLTSQFFQLAPHDSPLSTGLRFLPWTVTPLLVAPLAGAVSDRTGARVLIVPGLLMQAGRRHLRLPPGPGGGRRALAPRGGNRARRIGTARDQEWPSVR